MKDDDKKAYDLKLQDVVFIHLAQDFETNNKEFRINSEIPIPVQLQDGTNEIKGEEGISIAMLASGLIKVIAHKPEHDHISYYIDFLLALQPDVVHELQLAGASKAKTGDLDFAIELYLAAVHINPAIPELYVNIATLYARHAKQAVDDENNELFDSYTRKQIAILKEGLKAHPLSHLLLSEFGLLQLFLGNDEIALEYLKKYLSYAPDGEKRQIIEEKVKELQQQSQDEQTLQEAFDEMQLGNEQQALNLISEFCTRNEKNWSGWFIKGWALRRLERYEEAQQCFLTCLTLGERNPDIYNELSICALELKERELAKDYLEIALEMEEDNLTILSNLAFLLLEDEQYNKVSHLLIKAKKIDENDPMIKNLIEQLFIRSGIELHEEEVVHD
ncbi:MAG: hypothetical protein ACOCJN_11595 [Spirochaetaceae bacterium JB067]